MYKQLPQDLGLLGYCSWLLNDAVSSEGPWISTDILACTMSKARMRKSTDHVEFMEDQR